jgi:hypothetical protein
MTDLGTFKVQTERLREAADIWADCSTDSLRVHSDIAPAVGQGDTFGILAGSSGVSGFYDKWVQSMSTAAQTASNNFAYLEAALDSTANAYDGSDQTSATSMDKLDGMIEA